MNVFEYKPLNGILRYFYDKGKSFYSRNVKISSSSNAYSGTKAECAFDFNNETHWFGSYDLENQTLNFCFDKKYQLFVSEYEIRASKEWLSPRIWSFAGSNDESNWEHKEEFQYEMKNNGCHKL